MKREIREHQYNLLMKSMKLRELSIDDKVNSDEIKKIQDDTYKRWIFFKNLSKELDMKVKNEK